MWGRPVPARADHDSVAARSARVAGASAVEVALEVVDFTGALNTVFAEVESRTLFGDGWSNPQPDGLNPKCCGGAHVLLRIRNK
jgi:hypothetical protein